MHDRIIQISEKKGTKKICSGAYYDHWFTREIADYVDDIDDEYIPDELTFLGKRDGLRVDADARTITVESREAYFAAGYERVKKAAAVLANVSLADFAVGNSDVWSAVMEIRNGYDDRFSYYVADGGDDCGLVTMDDWIRGYAEIGKQYHIINVLDYHW